MDDKNGKIVFWGCFIALITTSFAFFTRMYLCDVRFPTDFAIEKGTVGALKGAGVWPFAISIILFSLIIDRVGYRFAMIFSFVCYAVYMVMACMAYAAIQGVEGEAGTGSQDGLREEAERRALTGLCHTLLNSAEFIFVD